MTDKSSIRSEKLQTLKMKLEGRLVAIDVEQKTLEEETQDLRQTVAIQELQEAVRKRRDELAVLRLQKKKLEDESNGMHARQPTPKSEMLRPLWKVGINWRKILYQLWKRIEDRLN